MKNFDPEKFLEKYRLLILVVLSVSAGVLGGVFFLANQSGDEDIRILTKEELEEVKGLHTANLTEGKFLVDIGGQVVNPGIIEVEEGASLFDVVQKAGGFTSEADQAHIQKSINLAELVENRGKYYFPSRQEGVSRSETSESVVKQNSGSFININSATVDELDSLSGIGPSTAEKIIENRPYKSIEEIMNVSGIGTSTFEKIKDEISV